MIERGVRQDLLASNRSPCEGTRQKGFFMVDSAMKEVLYSIIIRAVLSPKKGLRKRKLTYDAIAAADNSTVSCRCCLQLRTWLVVGVKILRERREVLKFLFRAARA
jgi:hypothetical protein